MEERFLEEEVLAILMSMGGDRHAGEEQSV
jgi:hypothetical protein